MSISPKPSGNVLDYFDQNDTNPHTKSTDGDWTSLTIINDGTSSLILIVNDIAIEVKANESYTDDFEDFDSVQISAGATYRLVCRG